VNYNCAKKTAPTLTPWELSPTLYSSILNYLYLYLKAKKKHMVKEPPYVKQLSTNPLSKIRLKRIVQKSIVRIVNFSVCY
jgi:hypothetical protein